VLAPWMGDGRPTQPGDKESRQLKLPHFDYSPLGTAGYLNSGKFSGDFLVYLIFKSVAFPKRALT